MELTAYIASLLAGLGYSAFTIIIAWAALLLVLHTLGGRNG